MNDNPEHLIDTPTKAEELAAAWMRSKGFTDAAVGPRGRDRGIDVYASHGLAQVKWGGGARRGAPAIQNLYGARGRDHHKALLFFTGPSYGYTDAAIDVADDLDVALFRYDSRGQVSWCNETARRIVRAAEAHARELAGQPAGPNLTDYPTTSDAHPGSRKTTTGPDPEALGCAWVLIFLFCLVVAISWTISTVASGDNEFGGVAFWYVAAAISALCIRHIRGKKRRSRAAVAPPSPHRPDTRLASRTPPLLESDPEGRPVTQTLDPDNPDTPLRAGEVAVSPADVSWFDYRTTPEDMADALLGVHAAMGDGTLPDLNEAGTRFTFAPDPEEGFYGLVSIIADLAPHPVYGEDVIRVSWVTRSEASTSTAQRAADDGHIAAARANRLLARHLGDWEDAG